MSATTSSRSQAASPFLLSRPHEPRIETVNDRDTYLANFWRALTASPEGVAEYANWPVKRVRPAGKTRWLTDQPKFPREDSSRIQTSTTRRSLAGGYGGISQWIGAGWCSRPEWTGRGAGRSRTAWVECQHTLSGEMGVHSAAAWAGNLAVGARGLCSTAEDAACASLPSKLPHLDGHGKTGAHRKQPLMSAGDERASQNSTIRRMDALPVRASAPRAGVLWGLVARCNAKLHLETWRRPTYRSAPGSTILPRNARQSPVLR